MRKGERPFSDTRYSQMSEKRAAERMLSRGYCQVSRAFGYVARVDVSDRELLVRIGKYIGSPVAEPVSRRGWYDFYRRCVSEDVITGVPDSIMFMIHGSGGPRIPSTPSDAEFIAMITELGLAS